MSENKQRPRSGMMGGARRGPGPMPTEKAKDFKGSLKRLIKYLRPFLPGIIAVMFFAAASTVFTILGPNILKDITNELQRGFTAVITGSGEGINFDYIGNIMLWLIGLYTVAALFQFFQGYIIATVSAKLSYNLRNDIMCKINRLPLSFFHKYNTGEVLSRITNDVDTLSQGLNQSVTQVITSACTIVGVLIMMFSISWEMTLIALATIPVTLALISVIVKKSQKHFEGQQKYLGTVNGHIEEMYGGQVVVRAFNGEEKAVKEFDVQNDLLCVSSRKANFISGLMQPFMAFIGNLGYVVICLAGAAMAAGGTLGIGDIQAFVQYLRSFNQPITQLGTISSQLQMTVAAAERVFELLDTAEETVTEAKLTTESTHINGDVRFEHVRFGYNKDKIIIKDFSADIKAGQKVAIVGPTGAGKTTMVKLLMRFYDLDGGAIYVDGNNITDFDRKDIRREFAMVLQDTWLYNATIMENIRYGKQDATDEEVYAAARSAQVDHFVRTLPSGYNMIINEEANNISQGQKQLLTIARAILANCRILILDEATSSVDTRTEIMIQKAMDNLMAGRTSFIIAHRLSTIRNADLILFLKDGDIVEQGTHDELMAKGGAYAQLYNSQFEKIS